MRFKYLQQIFYWCYTTKQENNMCSGKREKDETENENMFWFEVEDRVSGEGLKEVGSK